VFCPAAAEPAEAVVVVAAADVAAVVPLVAHDALADATRTEARRARRAE